MPENDTASIMGVGSYAFEEIVFAEPGTNEYKVTEAKGNNIRYIYDDTTYSVTVNVTNNNGKLEAKPEYRKNGTSSADSILFENVFSAGYLTVTKTIEGNAGNRDKKLDFTITLGDTSIDGTCGDMTFEKGIAVFTLKDGDKKITEGLPNGVSYTVAEDDYGDEG